MAEKVADFEKLLRDLSARVGEDDAAQIRALLEQVRARLTLALLFFLTILIGRLSRGRGCLT